MIFLKKQIVLIKLFIIIFLVPIHGATVLDKIEQIEQIIQQDPGNRGVYNFYTKALFEAATNLKKANHVAILTGFFIPSAQRPETDGPLGAVFLAQSLIALGKKVTIVTDTFCLPSVTACTDLLDREIFSKQLDIAVFPENKEEQNNFVASLCDKIDCLVSIERVGRTFDGTYRSMRAIDITDKTAPLDDLFIYAQNNPKMQITTISIGDGGNEIGMGDKIEEVKKYILNGNQIACVIPADHLIVTGVSNWGGYALAGALWCIAHEKGETVDLVYPPTNEQFKMLENMILMDCCDGVLGKSVLSVDGLPWDVHEKTLESIRAILK